MLPERNWHPDNRRALLDALARWRERASRERLVAVFDFDNTTVFHDAGEALMRLQLDRLAFQMSPEELRGLVPDEISGVRALADGTSIADARDDVVDALAAQDKEAFRAKLAWLYAELDDTPGIGAGFAYPFLASWLGGYTAEEARELMRDAARAAADEPFGAGSWTSPDTGRIGARTAAFETGLGPQPEMQDLYRALLDAGVEVHVVSASQQHVVEAALVELGYPHDGVRVWGMRLEEGEGGKMRPRLQDAARYPMTWRAGKRELIERHIERAPVLVGGDSDTDFEMMTGFEQTEVRLLINRNPSPRTAVHALLTDERTLVQGRCEPEGRFQPSRETRAATMEEGAS
jgi:phosphoserine phosphatase